MKNLFCILLSVLLFWGCSDENLIYTTPDTNETPSHHVSVETAKKRLLAFVSQMSEDGESTRSTIAGIDGKITSVTAIDKNRQPLTRSNDASAAYYVFRFGDHEGFAIMGADDRIPAMLAVASGDPDSNNPDADLPDSTFWTPPQINDTTSGTWTPGPDPNALSEPYTTVCPTNLIRVKWGQRSPFNVLCYDSGSEPIYQNHRVEYRPPTACVTIAQLLTCQKLRNRTFIENGIDHNELNDTISMEALARFKGAPQFAKNPEMSLKVAKLYRYLKTRECLYYSFPSISNALFDSIYKVYYVEAMLGYVVGNMHSPEYNDVVLHTLRYLKLNPTNIVRCGYISPDSYESCIIYSLQDQLPVVMGKRYDDYFLIYNAMSFDSAPNIYYLLVNKGKDGMGDGYYLSSGLKYDDCYTYWLNE